MIAGLAEGLGSVAKVHQMPFPVVRLSNYNHRNGSLNHLHSMGNAEETKSPYH
jgi:hypothetical protein